MVHNTSSSCSSSCDETERVMKMIALLRIRIDLESTLRQSTDSVFGKKNKKNKKQRLGLELSQIDDVTNMLTWWLEFFNKINVEDDDAFAETRNNREFQRWILNAVLDRFDVVDAKKTKCENASFVMRLARCLLIDFERHRNHSDDLSNGAAAAAQNEDEDLDDTQSTISAASTSKNNKKKKGKNAKSSKMFSKGPKLADLSLQLLSRAFEIVLNDGDASSRKEFLGKVFESTGRNAVADSNANSKTLWKLIDRLMEDTQFKRAEILLLGPLHMMLRFVSENDRLYHAKIALSRLERLTKLSTGISSAIRAILRVVMSQARHLGDLKLVLDLSKQCQLCSEDDEDDEDEIEKSKYPLLQSHSKCLDIAKDEILNTLNDELSTIEKSFVSMRPMIRQWNRARDWSQEERTKHVASPHPCGNISKALETREVSIFKRLLKIVEILKSLTSGPLAGPSVLDNLLKTLLRTYVK